VAASAKLSCSVIWVRLSSEPSVHSNQLQSFPETMWNVRWHWYWHSPVAWAQFELFLCDYTVPQDCLLFSQRGPFSEPEAAYQNPRVPLGAGV